MPRPPSIQWYYKQYLGDNKVLAMDWDARGMHVHLLMLSIQEEPPGTIPADDAAIRRWLSLPSSASLCSQRGSERTPAKAGYDSGYDCRCNDCVWRRVKPQLLAAWQPEGERLVNSGMAESCERKGRYAARYENGTKSVRESDEITSNRSKEVFDLEVQDQKQELLKKRTDRSGTRVPPGYKVSEDMRVFARDNHLPDPDLHVAHFIDYWASQPGRKGVKTDWDATFRNWLRNTPNFRSGNGKITFEERARQEREIAKQYAARTGG